MNTEALKSKNLLDTTHTAAAALFAQTEYPWEVLPLIKGFVSALGKTLDANEYTEIAPEVWVHKSVKIAPTASLNGPCIIGEGTEVRQCAFVRGSALIGAHCVIGNSTEVKNSIIFDNCEVPHYNYVGESVLGFHAHMGAGSILSNIKADKKNVTIAFEGEKIQTGLRKMGAVLGDYVDLGCNSVCNPGSVIGPRTNLYPLSFVRGFVPADHVYKKQGETAEKHYD